MEGEARNWKWMVPGLLVPLLFVLQMWINDYAGRAGLPFLLWCGCFTVPAMFIFAVQAAAGFRAYYRRLETDDLVARQRALNTTQATQIAEALRSLHPEAVRVLNRFGVRTQWQVKIDAERGGRDWILLGTNVHFGFIEYVLDNSTTSALFPMNQFSEGSRQWDPDGLIEDREQYREFEGWLVSRLMVTRPYGNRVAQFLNPWTPELVKEVMGLVGTQDVYKPSGASNANGLPLSAQREAVHGAKLDDLIPLDRSLR